MTQRPRSTRHPLVAFEAHSVALFAALAFAGLPARGHDPGPGVQAASLSAAPSGPRGAPATQRLSTPAQAAFDRADADRDGRLSRAEAEHLPAIASRFDSLDLDRDGRLSPDELARALQNPSTD